MTYIPWSEGLQAPRNAGWISLAMSAPPFARFDLRLSSVKRSLPRAPISIEPTSLASSEGDAILPSKRSNLLCTPWALRSTRCSAALANSPIAQSTPPASGAADPARNADGVVARRRSRVLAVELLRSAGKLWRAPSYPLCRRLPICCVVQLFPPKSLLPH